MSKSFNLTAKLKAVSVSVCLQGRNCYTQVLPGEKCRFPGRVMPRFHTNVALANV